MKKTLLFVAFTTMVFATFLLAQISKLTIQNRWKTVEYLAEKQLPESALKEVEIILSQAQKEKNSVETIKALVYKVRFTLDKNPDEAPALIQDFEAFTNKSTDTAERVLLHSMTADLYAQFYQKDQWNINRRTEVNGFVPDDMKEWTKNIYFDKISKHLAASLENPTILQKTDVMKFASLLEVGNDSRTLHPTLFDLLANRKIAILQQISSATTVKNPLKNPALFADIPQFAALKMDTAYKASIENSIIETYQQLLAFRLNEKNVLALIFTDLQYLKYLQQHSEIENAESLYLSALKRLKNQYSDNEAVVEVYAEMGNFYVRNVDKGKNIDYKKIAYNLCEDGIKQFPDCDRIGLLHNIQQEITRRNINISHNQVLKPGANLKVKINSSNISVLKLSIFKVNTIAQTYYSHKHSNRYNKETYPKSTLVETRLIDIKADPNFGSVDTDLMIKADDFGIYEFTLEANDNNDSWQRAIGGFTVSNFAFMVRSNKPEISDLYVLDRNTGKPQADVKVIRYNNKWAGNGYELQQLSTFKSDANGLCQYSHVANHSNDVLFFEKGNDKYFSSTSSSYFYNQSTYNYEKAYVNLFTDRSLYRPGQTVYFKGIVFYSNKEKQEVAAGIEYEVKLYDTNEQEVSQKRFKTNKFGSFAGEFVLPEGGLNGAYRLVAGVYSQNIWVEEYKRPTFEVKIDKPKTEISFGEKVTLIGNVKAFAGYSIGDAKVKYRVVKRTHRYCWWWSEPDKEITNAIATSKSDGTFDVTFTPEKTKGNTASPFGNEQFYTYTVYADVTDPKGETQQGQQTLSVGDKSLFILAEIASKVDKKQVLEIELSTETLNGEKLNSNVKYTLCRLEETDVYAENLNDKTPLKEADKVLTGSFDTQDNKLSLNVNKLNSGRYKMVFTTLDAHGKEVKLEKIFVLYSAEDKRPPVKSYEWLLTPKTQCEVGEKAQIKFGTSAKNTSVLYELMQGNKVIESRWITFNDEILAFEIPFKESYGAGVTVMFSFIKDEQFFTESVQITKKVAEKKLTPTLSVFRNKLLPGEKAEWTITIPEAGIAKKAELLVDMYDASLDKLRTHNWSFNPTYHDAIKNSPKWNANGFNVESDVARMGNYTQKAVHEFITDKLNWFGLDISGRNNFRIRGVSTMTKSMQISDVQVAQENSMLNELVVVAYGSQKKRDMTGSVARISPAMQGKILVGTNGKSELAAPLQIRTNFNETAFFYPQLATDALGNVKFTFTAPESLTRWNVKMLAHTKDLFFGYDEAQVVTQKDLMVQMNLPRFVRRSDKLVLSANVINLTDKELTANVQFEMIDPATEKVIYNSGAAPLSSRGAGGEVMTLAAKETKVVEWEVTEFSAYELVTCKVVAYAGNFSDGEQKYLPVLPDKIMVTESMPLNIRGNQTRTFNFESLLNNASKVDSKSLTVEFSSNPTWYAVQALPTLSTPESDNAIDYFTAYYVNSLATFIANSNPKIAATFNRWKKAGGSRDALLSNLEKNKELKNMLLEETPWVMAAKDETEQKKQIALLFDLNMQKNQAKQYLDKLVSLQMPSGGFSWFNGMFESRYITQEIMLNLARLNRLTGTDNCQLSTTNSALGYLDLEIARDFDELKKYRKNYENEMCVGNMQLFYLHLRSEYPTIPVNVSAQEAVKFYTAQSEKYWTNFSLYGKAMVAVVANRNGKKQTANIILKSLKENALKTDEFGMYWAKNTAGYFWNERPIAVQSGIIEAFAEVSKNQADIDEMKIWLLKKKQTQRWDSPLTTVDAIYSLLHYGSDWLANDGGVKITVGNTLLQPQSVEAGTGYFKQSIPMADIRPEMGKVTVSTIGGATIGGATQSRTPNKSGIGWGAMYWQYYQDLDKVSGQSGPLQISKKLFVLNPSIEGATSSRTLNSNSMIPIEQTKLKKGDKVITRLVITTDRDMEFVALKDLRAACFEPVDQLSGCAWKENVCYYKTTKDASTQFFFSFLPKGTYVFEYEMWANNSGEYTSGIASLQCQYAPEFVGHTGGERIRIW